MRILCAVLVLASLGCGGVSVAPFSDPVDVTGKVTMSGKPLTDVKLNFQPTGDGLPAVVDVKGGAFTAKLTPGKYTYYMTPGKKEAAFKAIPEKYLAGSMDRQHEIAAGTTLELLLD